MLLASVAASAVGGAAWGQTVTNNVTVSSPDSLFIVTGNEQLINTATGAIILQPGSGPPQPTAAVLAAGNSASAILNAGLIQANGAAGTGIHVTSGGSVGTITNSGTVSVTQGIGSAIAVDTLSSVGTLNNTGLLLSNGSTAVAIGGSIGALTNGATGTIATSIGAGVGVTGALTVLTNNGLITAGEPAGVGVNVADGGAVGLLSNSGTISATGAESTAIQVAGNVGTIVNSGLIAASGTFPGTLNSAIDVTTTGLIGSITNQASGTITNAAPTTSAISVSGSIGSISNAGLIQATGTGANAIQAANGGTITTISNSGQVLAGAQGGTAVAVGGGGTVGLINNTGAGLISATGSSGVGISVLGNIGTITNGGTGATITGSAAAISIAGSVGAIGNNTGGTILTGGAYSSAILVQPSGSVGSINNNGSGAAIVASGSYGSAIALFGTGSVSSVGNSGTIEVTGSWSTAVNLLGTNTIGNLTNSGTILATATYGAAMGVNTASSITSLINTGTVISTAASYGAGIAVAGSAGSIVALNNAGTIQANGINAQAIVLGNAGSITNLTNSGLVAANSVSGGAIVLFDSSSIGTVTNSGQIQANGSSGIAFDVTGTTSIGSLSNSAGGTITATGSLGIPVQVGGTIGTLSNSGLISGDTLAGQAIQVTGSLGTIVNVGTGTISGGTGVGINGNVGTISNSGLIQGVFGAISVSGTLGALSNSGTIVGSGVAIFVGGFGTVTNGITNSAGGVIQATPVNGGSTAIEDVASVPLTVINAGTIIGNIQFGMVDTGSGHLTITGAGTVIGDVYGLRGYGSSVTFSPTGTYTLANQIYAIDTVNVAGGTLQVQQFGTITTPIALAQVLNVSPGAVLLFNSGTILANQVNNNGLLAIGTNTPTINGSYTQNATGQLSLGINGSGNGQLQVTGSAAVAGGLIVNVMTSQALSLIGQTYTVLSSGSLTAGSLTATDANPFVQFTISETAGNLLLTGVVANPSTAAAEALAETNSAFGNVASPGDTGATDGLVSLGLANAEQARYAITGLQEHLAIIGDATDYYRIRNTLDGLTPLQLAQFLRQVQPAMVTTAQALLGSIAAVNGGATTSIGNRLIAARATSGMAAGDAVGRGFEAWVQPFGSFLTQNEKQGIDGFTANTYGAALGADTMVRPDLRLGVALSFGNSDVMFDGNLAGNKTSVWNTQLAAYGTWFQGGFFVDGILGGGFNWYSTHENIAALGTSRDAGFTGTQINAKLGAGYDWTAPNGLIVTPGVALQEIHLNTHSYTTHGAGVLNVAVNGAAMDILQSRVGARVAYAFSGPGSSTLTPEVHAYYVHNFGSDQQSSTASFTGGGPNFTTTGPTRDRDTVNLGIGLTVAQVGPLAVSGVYDYAGGATSHDHTFFFRFRTEF